MILKENIKAKVDQLDNYELRVVELVIESLKRSKKSVIRKPGATLLPYQEVIKLMEHSTITSNDIHLGRQDRL